LSTVKTRPILTFDEDKLKNLVCDTFKANKRLLMKRGATQIRDLMAKNLESKLRNEMHNKEVQDV